MADELITTLFLHTQEHYPKLVSGFVRASIHLLMDQMCHMLVCCDILAPDTVSHDSVHLCDTFGQGCVDSVVYVPNQMLNNALV